VREFLAAQRERWRELEGQLRQQIDDSAAEAQSLRARCEELEQELAGRPAGNGTPADATALEDLQRRYDMALEDLRGLKAQNAELRTRVGQVSNLPGAGKSQTRPAPSATGTALNWEAEKLRILAALESEAFDSGPQAVAERLKIEEVVRATERALAEKDREIEHLQQLLRQQSANLGAVAVGAAALEGIADQDAIVREERENLRRLQEQWREKLRQAEVEISVERAKLARKQAEIDEKLRTLEHAGADDQADGLSPSGKPPRGRWLARLGLGDGNEPRPR
jgi:hypothetical protein